MIARRSLPTHVRFVMDLRAEWLARPTPEALRAWTDALDALTDSEAALYARALPRERSGAPAAAA